MFLPAITLAKRIKMSLFQLIPLEACNYMLPSIFSETLKYYEN